ncbi:DUF1062 domain-containing protein [Bosea sp. UNC402CLCol]|uniref:DUF1062 domain-containing protein n=1 Tax=Bosea sp. UNC402CLCol TaxID=1510531 RepID=UPI0005712E68|nr:DUF1062 domain-containing protein [Bosea sp. UNC402CLCol]
MCRALRVRWTITPKIAPRPWIACSGCGGLKAFQSSGKIRLNANGRKLDAWLIYKCVDCEKTWNRPLFERRNLRDIDPSVLEALQSNDPEWIRVEAFNLDALRRKSQRIDEFSEYDILKDVVCEAPCWTELQIALTVPLQVGTRLDRLLASELAVSRTRLQELHDLGRLRIDAQRSDALRRHIRTGTVAIFDLSPEPDRERLWRSRATGAVL